MLPELLALAAFDNCMLRAERRAERRAEQRAEQRTGRRAGRRAEQRAGHRRFINHYYQILNL